jgi:AGCS family alanine or glycine:cation symporter
MFHHVYQILEQLDTIFWGYVGFSLIMVLGLYFSVTTRLFQVRAMPLILNTLCSSVKSKSDGKAGVHPIKILFASVGSMVGIGNLVGIITAVQMGGPGALMWIWIAALCGSLIKYSEVFLGLKHRVKNDQGSYDGGPMYFLQQAFSGLTIPIIVSILMCIYGVEIYQFSVIADSVSSNWLIPREGVVVALLGLVLFAGLGGVSRVAKISSLILPVFIVGYIAMGLWVIVHHAAELPSVIRYVIKSAFTGHAAVGGFAGSTMLLAIQHGISRAAYSADIGIGNDSVIHSESQTIDPAAQARLAVVGVFIDNIVCTISVFLVLVTGVWKSVDSIAASNMVQAALSQHFPMMDVFMPLFLLILGYSTIIAYFCVGIKCASFLSPKHGKRIYFGYAMFALPAFSYLDQSQALLLMSIAGSLLLMINLTGIFRLRKQVFFTLEPMKVVEPLNEELQSAS